MTPKQIKALRKRLGESTAQFGARFHRSARTVEDWEWGKARKDRKVSQPDPMVLAEMRRLMAELGPVKKDRGPADSA